MTYAGVTNGDLYHGNMRFDVNISVAKKGATELGKRAEVKNLNSFRSVERAAEYEFKRQVDLLESGQEVIQETRGWNDDKQITTSQRSKEDAQDYRYMPDPDIPPVILTPEKISEIQSTVPKLPASYRDQWSVLNLDSSVVNTLLGVQKHAGIISYIQEKAGNEAAKRVANWFASALGRSDEAPAVGGHSEKDCFIELSDMVAKKELSSSNAKEIFVDLVSKPGSPREIAEKKNMLQNSDTSVIEQVVDEVLADEASQKAIKDIKSGNEKAIGYLVGQVMKRSKGQANPAMATDIIKKKL